MTEKKTSMQLVQENRKEIVDRILNFMEKGELPWKKGWQTPFRMHNPCTHKDGQGYRGINCLSLLVRSMEKGYTDPRWVTFKQAKDNGWSVKQGEKATRIEHWKFGKEMDQENPETHEMEKVFVPYKHPAVSYYAVFNAEQIEGMPPLEIKRLDLSKDEQLDSLISDVRNSSFCPIYEEKQNRAYYSPIEDKIVLPTLELFDSKQEFLSTMIHEMGHSTGHSSRLDRDLLNQGGFGSEGYALEELRAELSSVFLQDDLGISLPDSKLENNSAYLQGWISHIKENPNALFEAIRDADEICKFLKNEVDKVRDKTKGIKEINVESVSQSASGEVHNRRIRHR